MHPEVDIVQASSFRNRIAVPEDSPGGQDSEPSRRGYEVRSRKRVAIRAVMAPGSQSVEQSDQRYQSTSADHTRREGDYGRPDLGRHSHVRCR